MDPLKTVASFIGWLSGSLAGLTAVLYALGFIAMMAHQRLLGLDWAFVARDTLVFLGVGGQVAATFILLAPLTLLVVLAIGETIGWLLGIATGWKEGWRRRPGAAARWLSRNAVWFLAVLAAGLMTRAMDGFGGALSVTGLLFMTPADLAAATGITAELVNGTETAARQNRATDIVVNAIAALGVTWYAARLLMKTPAPAIAVVIFAGVGIQALGAVPIAYGIFSMKLELHPIRFPAGDLPRGLRLIEREGAGLWLWDPATREVRWLEPGQVETFTVGKPLPVVEPMP